MAKAAEGAIKDLRYAYQILGSHVKELQAWNDHPEYTRPEKIGTGGNLNLTREYIISAVNRLRLGRKGVM